MPFTAQDHPGEPQALLLDTTLRDGSYAVDFRFTAADTAKLAGVLDQAGVPFIEVGHGLGLNASPSKGRAAESDRAYLEAAVGAVARAKVGCFFIPGIGRAEDLRQAAQAGARFIRVGTNANQVDQGEPFVRLAKELGLWVSCNLMKSYVLTPEELARESARVASWGVDLICLVDSAGGMTPREISAYLRAMRQETDTRLGFHGHDNLGLAVYNSLHAHQEGASVVDVSLQGMGRSAGNASTEQVCLLFKREGIDLGVDVNLLMDVGAALIRPLLRSPGLDSLAVTSGYAQFHSSYLGMVLDYANRHRIDPRELIVRLCEQNKVDAPEELLEELSRQIGAERTRATVSLSQALPESTEVSPAYEERDLAGRVEHLLERLRNQCAKYGRLGVFNLILPYAPEVRTRVSGILSMSARHVLAEAVVATAGDMERVCGLLVGRVDAVLLDGELKTPQARELLAVARRALGPDTVVLSYQHLVLCAWAVADLLANLRETGRPGPVILAGEGALRENLTRLLDGAGEPWLDARAATPPDLAQAGALVACGLDRPSLTPEMIGHLDPEAVVVEAGMGGLGASVLEAAHARGIRVLRRDVRPFLGGLIEGLLGGRTLVREVMGRGQVQGVGVVAGGVLGRPGELVVDHFTRPRRILGVADGLGGIRPPRDQTETDRVNRVQQAMLEGEIHGR